MVQVGEGPMAIRRLTLTALMAALVFVFTVAVRLPTAAGGYLHLGDAAVAFSAFAFGPLVGAVAGALGTGLADLYGGYPQFALISFLVHGSQGWLMGWLVQGRLKTAVVFLSIVCGSIVVVAGYFFAEVLLYGVAVALSEVLPNALQSMVGAGLGVSLFLAVRRAYPPIARYQARERP